MIKKAFTLSEVIITLSIIGIIAAIVIPNVYNGYKKRILVTQLKSAYSQVSSAVDIAIALNGNKFWCNNNFKKFVAPNLKIKLDCSGVTKDNCLPVQDYKAPRMSQADSNQSYCLCHGKGQLDRQYCYSSKFVLSNGIIVSARDSSNDNMQSEDSYDLYIDVNGEKGPNKLNYDLFLFVMTKNGLELPDVVHGGGNNCLYYTKRVLTTNKIDY